MTKCSQCKRELQDSVFFYNDKNHTTCFSCYERRKKKTNYCDEVCDMCDKVFYMEGMIEKHVCKK